MGDEKFGQIALGINRVEQGRRLFAGPKGIEIGSTREYKCVDMVERIDDNVYAIDGRDKHWRSTGINHLAVILVHKHGTTILKVGC
mgnify:CR=1 FL=1